MIQGGVRTTIILAGAAFLILVGSWLILLYRETQHTETAGFAMAKATAEQVAMVRRVYTEQIVSRALGSGMDVHYDFAHRERSLPLPATLVKLLGSEMRSTQSGIRLRLYSRYPFPFRASNETYDPFEKSALAYVEQHQKEPFVRSETLERQAVLRYAVADVMTAKCVACHNSHPESPKTDWKVGDVRGVVEVIIPLDEVKAQMAKGDLRVAWLLAGSFLLLSSVVVLLVRHDLARAERERLSIIDPLTGLPNRRAGEEAIAREIGRARRDKKPLGFALLDIDHFKQINDNYGHGTGDAVLRELSNALRSTLRTMDLAVRWGGEEFLLVLPGADISATRAIVDRVREAVSQRKVADLPPITCSAGTSELGPEEAHEMAITRADERLYEAKTSGRNQVR